MNKQATEQEYLLKINELTRTVDSLAAHNVELKTLILRCGDQQMKSKLEKLMKKYSGERLHQDVA